MTRYPREEIFAALFALAQTANTQATPFAAMSRRFIPWSERSDLEAAELYQLQLEQPASQATHFGLTKWNMKALWVVYLPVNTDDLVTATSPSLNNYMDALEAVLRGPQNAQVKQTLRTVINGVAVDLVNNAYIDGSVLIDEGLNSGPPALISIPITINVGM